MQWGGALGRVLHASGMTIQPRSFGTFEAEVPPAAEGSVKAIILEAVRRAVESKGSGADATEIGAAATSYAAPHLAAMGLAGAITVTMVSVSEEDRAAIQNGGMNAVQAKLAAMREAAAAPAPAPAPAGYAVGETVLVQWSDGHRYPGQVRDVRPDQVAVGFQNGAVHWVPVAYLSRP